MARILPTVDDALARIRDNEGPEPRDCEVLGDEVLRLRAEVDRLTLRWQDGEPPEGVFVWREGRVAPAETERIRGKMHFIGTNGDAFLWGTARWAPIARPT